MPTHDFEQDPHAPSMVKVLDTAKGLGEWSRNDASPLANLQVAIEANRSRAVAPGDERLDDAAWRRLWLLNAHDQ